jgi:hypothetical protein
MIKFVKVNVPGFEFSEMALAAVPASYLAAHFYLKQFLTRLRTKHPSHYSHEPATIHRCHSTLTSNQRDSSFISLCENSMRLGNCLVPSEEDGQTSGPN